MRSFSKSFVIIASSSMYLPSMNMLRRLDHRVPIVDLYYRTTGDLLQEEQLPVLSRKHPNIDKLSHEQLQCTLQTLQKFGVTALDACKNLHVFSMNPISMDNYGEILKECQFIDITAKHIIKYHTIAKTKPIASLKKAGLISEDTVLEQVLLDCFKELPTNRKTLIQFPDKSTSILTIRTSVLERYLKWRISISTEEFQKYCQNYLPLRHRPMADIRLALDLAENEIKFSNDAIRRNGCIISSDPLNTKLILENAPTLAGMDIREVLRIEPSILKNNYNALPQIRDILESYRIPMEAQALGLKVYCMRAATVKERLEELSKLKEFKILSSNPRVLSLVIHKNKFLNRLNKIQAAKKQCYSFNHLISSSKIFNKVLLATHPAGAVKTGKGNREWAAAFSVLSVSPLCLLRCLPSVALCRLDSTASGLPHGEYMIAATSRLALHAGLVQSVDEFVVKGWRREDYYISSFGSKACSRDIEMLINYSLKPEHDANKNIPSAKGIMARLRRHKYCLHVALGVIDENIQYLKTKFDDQVICNNCQLLLYPVSDVEHYIDNVLKMRLGEDDKLSSETDFNYHIDYKSLSDDQLLSLVLYEIEKKYHFSGDGIWARVDGVKADQVGS